MVSLNLTFVVCSEGESEFLFLHGIVRVATLSHRRTFSNETVNVVNVFPVHPVKRLQMFFPFRTSMNRKTGKDLSKRVQLHKRAPD